MIIAVAIITKDRENKLARCLSSIQKQSRLPDQLVIVNTSEHENLKELLNKDVRIPFKYFHAPNLSVANARNLALKLANTDLLSFIDDDCLVSSRYLENVSKYFKVQAKREGVAFILGKSKLSDTPSLQALAEHIYSEYWYEKKNQEAQPYSSPFNFDTKNVAINLKILKLLKIKFPTGFQLRNFDSSDTAMGFLLDGCSLKGRRLAKAIVWHDDGVGFLQLLQKQFYKGMIAKKIADRWYQSSEFVDLHFSPKKLLEWRSEYDRYFSQTNYKVFALRKKITIFIIIKLRTWSFTLGYWFAKKVAKVQF